MIKYSRAIDSREARDEVLQRVGGIKGADNQAVQIVDWSDKQQRTLLQNRSLYKYFRLLADALTSAGLEQHIPEIDMTVPWSPEAVKESLWKTIQHAVIDKRSTTQLSTADVGKVYDVLSRNLAERGVVVEWPSNVENMLAGQEP